MKVYEKLGIDLVTKDGIRRVFDMSCCDIPEEHRLNCSDKLCSKCITDYLFSEIKEREIDWSKVPKDTPVLVWGGYTDGKLHRYFAEFKDGKCWTYRWGATSWSNEESIRYWDHCELAFPKQAKEEWYK